MTTDRIGARFLVVALVVSCASGCRTRAAECRDLPGQLDPLTADFEKVVNLEPRAPISGDPATCAAYGNAAERMVPVAQKLGALALSVRDKGLQEKIGKYREHGEGWASAARQTQEACARRDSNAMSKAMGDVFHHGAQTRFVIAEINTYCSDP